MMFERFLRNKNAINVLSIESKDLPNFTPDDWRILSESFDF